MIHASYTSQSLDTHSPESQLFSLMGRLTLVAELIDNLNHGELAHSVSQPLRVYRQSVYQASPADRRLRHDELLTAIQISIDWLERFLQLLQSS